MNNQRDLNLIISKIEEEACYKTAGSAAVGAANWLDGEYVLIPRETLPTVQHPSLDDALGGETTVRLKNITELAFGGDYKKMRDLALQYLVMADFIENKAQKEKETKLKADQLEAYKILFPNTGMALEDFDIDHVSISQSAKNAINAILDLKSQLAKAQEKK